MTNHLHSQARGPPYGATGRSARKPQVKASSRTPQTTLFSQVLHLAFSHRPLARTRCDEPTEPNIHLL